MPAATSPSSSPAVHDDMSDEDLDAEIEKFEKALAEAAAAAARKEKKAKLAALKAELETYKS